MIFNTMSFHSKYNDRCVADDHGRSRSLRFPNPISISDPLFKTFKVQNSYQNFVRRSYKALDSIIAVDHQE